jgi:hypothetical protein
MEISLLSQAGSEPPAGKMLRFFFIGVARHPHIFHHPTQQIPNLIHFDQIFVASLSFNIAIAHCFPKMISQLPHRGSRTFVKGQLIIKMKSSKTLFPCVISITLSSNIFLIYYEYTSSHMMSLNISLCARHPLC